MILKETLMMTDGVDSVSLSCVVFLQNVCRMDENLQYMKLDTEH